jgi:alkanesulfonate monooxygenase SsuD/methylene tetrahydromethanopterin reductase-like flavin-dependent oxidoreductase (luciferase family)
MVEVMRAVWGGGFVEHHGEHYDFDRLEMRPVPPAPVPFLVGGDSEVALRRAARLDGWIGVNYSLDDLEAHCATLHRYRAEAGRADEPLEIVASPLAAPRPETVERLEKMGVTTVLTSAWMAYRQRTVESREQAIDFVGRYGEQFIHPLRGAA